jgi:hypothetical protein
MTNINNPEVEPLMLEMNTEHDRPYYYFFDPIYSDTGYRLPLVTAKGHKITMDLVRQSAAKAGMTVEQLLASPGMNILEEVKPNVYRPVNRRSIF